MRLFQMILIAVVVLPGFGQAFAQKKPAPITPAKPLNDGWEEIDKRLVFLMVRLANTEASLEAVEKAVGVGVRRKANHILDAKRSEQANEAMDRRGGGPVKWSEFYGRTAEKFFYHPTDQNSTYHTVTVLNQKSPDADNSVGEGVPSRQGLPVHQRPPQFDYIYKANRDAQARAERDAAELRNKVDALLKRRRQLEDEQVALWCQIAFRVVSRHELPKKPLYRFEPVPANPDSESRQRAEAAKASAVFMRRALSIVDVADQDQAKAFGSIKLVVTDACDNLDDAWIRLDAVNKDAGTLATPAGRFAALSKRLKDVANNLSDSYEVSIDADRFKDEQRKETFRGLLQESLVDYAQVVLALNEMSVMMASEWKTKPDLDKPLVFASLEIPERVTNLPASDKPIHDGANVPANEPAARKADWTSLFDGKSLKGWNVKKGGEASGWRVQNGELALSPIQGSPDLASDSEFSDFEFRCDFWLDSKTNSGIYLKGIYEVQLLDDPSFPNVKAAQRCGSIWNAIPPSTSAYRGPRQWNTLFVRLQGTTTTVVLNGTTVIDHQTIAAPTEGGTQGSVDRPGPIVLQSRGSAARFRNIEIRRLVD